MRERATIDGTLVTYRGASMRGTFVDGDLLRVRPLANGAAVAGEVIVFRDEHGATVVHRAQLVAGDGTIITKGDAHARPDDHPVMPAQVIGRVVAVVHRPKALSPRGVVRRLVAPLYYRAA